MAERDEGQRHQYGDDHQKRQCPCRCELPHRICPLGECQAYHGWPSAASGAVLLPARSKDRPGTLTRPVAAAGPALRFPGLGNRNGPASASAGHFRPKGRRHQRLRFRVWVVGAAAGGQRRQRAVQRGQQVIQGPLLWQARRRASVGQGRAYTLSACHRDGPWAVHRPAFRTPAAAIRRPKRLILFGKRGGRNPTGL
jgi:hypothetical protein